MRRRFALALAALALLARAAAAEPPAGDATGLAIAGAVDHPQSFDVAALRALPPTRLIASFATDRGQERGAYDGVLLWSLIAQAGLTQDPAEKHAGLRHTLTLTARDGYVVMLSVGELDPDLGAEPALIAYARDGAPLPPAEGLRLILPGDKRGARDMRDVVRIEVR